MAAVSITSWLGAPVHVARRVSVGLGDVSRERFDERNRNIAGPRRGLGQGREIERAGLAGFPDRARRSRRDDTCCRLSARQCGFKIEHMLETGDIVADGAHGGARQHWCEQRGEGSAHDARDLTIPASLCQSQSADPNPPASLLRCEYASPVI